MDLRGFLWATAVVFFVESVLFAAATVDLAGAVVAGLAGVVTADLAACFFGAVACAPAIDDPTSAAAAATVARIFRACIVISS